MKKKTKIKLVLTGVTLAASFVEGYLSSKAKLDKDKQIDRLINEVRDEIGTITSEVVEPETGNYSRIEQGIVGVDEYDRPVQGISFSVGLGEETESELKVEPDGEPFIDSAGIRANSIHNIATKDELKSLSENLFNSLEMATQAEDDDTHSMQDYHEDMKHVEYKLSYMSEQALMDIRDSAMANFYSMKEFRELVDQLYMIRKAFEIKGDE